MASYPILSVPEVQPIGVVGQRATHLHTNAKCVAFKLSRTYRLGVRRGSQLADQGTRNDQLPKGT